MLSVGRLDLPYYLSFTLFNDFASIFNNIIYSKLGLSKLCSMFNTIMLIHYVQQMLQLYSNRIPSLCSLKLLFFRDFPRSIVETTHPRRQLLICNETWS